MLVCIKLEIHCTNYANDSHCKHRNNAINMDCHGERLEQEQHHRGSWIRADGKSNTEVRIRTDLARHVFNNMNSIFSSQYLKVGRHLRTMTCYVWSNHSYGVETWSITKTWIS